MNSEFLRTLGLSDKAAQIYLSSLALGTTSVQKIAEKTNLKRPTTYEYIRELVSEGLLEKVPLGKREYYRAANPRVLQARAEQNAAQISKALPELEALMSAGLGRPNIAILEGEKGLRQVYGEIAEANSICFWSNLALFEQSFHDVFDELSSAISAKQIRTREIITDTYDAKRSSKRYAVTAGRSYSSRIASFEGIQNDNAIYGNVVALFRLHEGNLFVIRIEDAVIAEAMKALFEMAWKSAKPFIN